MRSRLALLTLLLAAAPAFAGPPAHDPLLDQMLNLGNHTIAGGATDNVAIPVLPNNNPVVGFSISFDYNDAADSFAYASDLRVVITPPFSAPYSIGGFSTPSDTVYDHQGPSDTGHYDSGPHYAWLAAGGTPKGGLWTFGLTNNYGPNGAVQWNNVIITLHKTPEPGSLGLLAMGGLALLRRRR